MSQVCCLLPHLFPVTHDVGYPALDGWMDGWWCPNGQAPFFFFSPVEVVRGMGECVGG